MEEQEIRKALDIIYEIRALRAENRHKSKTSGQDLRRGALMMLLQSTAQTLPLFVGKTGVEPPPLCGSIPADPNHLCKVRLNFLTSNIKLVLKGPVIPCRFILM